MRAHLLKPLPVRCTTIVATREGFPRDYQELEPVERRNIVSAVYTTVMLVEIEARVAIDSGKPRLWALVRFMKHTWEQLVEVARRFRADTEDERWWFWRAMGMKYDRSVNRLSEEVHMSDAVMDKLFQDLLPYSPYRRDKWTEALAKEAILEALRMLRAASRPFKTGMRMSIKIKSGRSLSAISIASSPENAAPTTCIPALDSAMRNCICVRPSSSQIMARRPNKEERTALDGLKG